MTIAALVLRGIIYGTFLWCTAMGMNSQQLSIKPSFDYCSTDSDLLQGFCTPIIFTRSGIDNFLRNSFNSGQYALVYLPYSFSHLIQFLEYGIATQQQPVFFESTIRLFLNKTKACRYICAPAFEELLIKLPDLLEEQTKIPETKFISISASVKDMLYDNFIKKFDLFKKDVDNFFNNLANDLTAVFRDHSTSATIASKEQFKQIIIRFLDIATLKLIWAVSDQDKVWTSVKTIANHLAVLEERHMINKDELDDLFKSLLESFCHFLDLVGTELSDQVLETIKKDAASGNLLLFTLEEQEQQLQSKRERVLEALCLVKARNYAKNRGIIVEPLPPAKNKK
jgi:hypothetical protein